MKTNMKKCSFLSLSTLTLAILFLNLVACSATAEQTKLAPEEPKQSVEEPKLSFEEYVETLKEEAIEKGFEEKLVEQAFAKVTFLKRSVKADKSQPEFKLTLDQYIPKAVPDWKIEQAQAAYDQHRELLQEIGKAYGVQPRFIVALWGVETNFGRLTGNHNLISSLTTMAYDGRREALFKKQLFAALTILEEGHATPENFKGSWAGAMGQVQFMPTSYLKYAVDYDKDQKKDIWNTHADIFASAANYLKTEGWKYDEIWGREATVPDDFDFDLTGTKITKGLDEWQRLGVRRLDGSDLPLAELDASVITPDDKDGRIFLVYNNYRVLMHWNRSYYFASAVSYLSDQIR